MPATKARKKEKMVKETSVSFVRKTTLEKKTCPQCGKEFTGAIVAKYCSRACRNLRYYESHGEQTAPRTRKVKLLSDR